MDDGFIELRPILNALVGGFHAEDHADAFGAKSTELAVEILVGAADPAVANFSYLIPILELLSTRSC